MPVTLRANRFASAGRSGPGALASNTSSAGTPIWKRVFGPVILLTSLISPRVASVKARRFFNPAAVRGRTWRRRTPPAHLLEGQVPE